MQYLASTWKLWSTEVYGEVKEMTPTRERYVAYKMIEKWYYNKIGVIYAPIFFCKRQLFKTCTAWTTNRPCAC